MSAAVNIGVSDSNAVMAGLVPAIHVLTCGGKDVDARDKPGHDKVVRYAP
jgi:hypothetical protein